MTEMPGSLIGRGSVIDVSYKQTPVGDELSILTTLTTNYTSIMPIQADRSPIIHRTGLTTALGGQKCFFHKLFNLKNRLDMDIFYPVKQIEINVLYQYHTAMKEIYLDFLPE